LGLLPPGPEAPRVYLAGAALGGSYLPHQEGPHLGVAWLLQGAEALLGYRPQVASLWRGVPRPTSSPWRANFALTGFGSTGFLHAPLLAERLASRL